MDMKHKILSLRTVVILIAVYSSQFVYAQFFLSGGYQGGAFGSGGDEIMMSVEEWDKNSNNYHLLSYPNPFHSQTMIEFSLSTAMEVELTVHDISNKKIRSLLSLKYIAGGDYTILWNGKNDNGNMVSRGVYYYKFTANRKVLIYKIVFL